MLHLIPAPAHRLAFRIGHQLRVLYWRLARPEVTGCCVIARDGAGHVLLARLSYGSGLWQFPGGAVDRGETPADAAIREFAEETGCVLTEVTAHGVLRESLHGATNIVHVFTGQFADDPRANGREVLELRCFPEDSLPGDLSPRVTGRLAMLQVRKAPCNPTRAL